jgi:hypothetical protein
VLPGLPVSVGLSVWNDDGVVVGWLLSVTEGARVAAETLNPKTQSGGRTLALMGGQHITESNRIQAFLFVTRNRASRRTRRRLCAGAGCARRRHSSSATRPSGASTRPTPSTPAPASTSRSARAPRRASGRRGGFFRTGGSRSPGARRFPSRFQKLRLRSLEKPQPPNGQWPHDRV